MGEHPPEAAMAVKTSSASEKLEYPAFPWSQGSGKNKPSLGDRDVPGISQSAPPSLQSSFVKGTNLPPSGRQSDGGPEISLQGGQLALFQEQLLQQQRQVQEQVLQLQALGGQLQSQEAQKARGALSPAEGEGLRSELKAAWERVRELEGDLGKEKTEHTEQQVRHCRVYDPFFKNLIASSVPTQNLGGCKYTRLVPRVRADAVHNVFTLLVQRRLMEMQEQLQSSVEAQQKAEEEWKALRERNSQLESVHQKTQLELTSTIDELKLKVRTDPELRCALVFHLCWVFLPCSLTGWSWSETNCGSHWMPPRPATLKR